MRKNSWHVFTDKNLKEKYRQPRSSRNNRYLLNKRRSQSRKNNKHDEIDFCPEDIRKVKLPEVESENGSSRSYTVFARICQITLHPLQRKYNPITRVYPFIQQIFSNPQNKQGSNIMRKSSFKKWLQTRIFTQ